GIRDKLVTGVQTCALPISYVDTDAAMPLSRRDFLRAGLLGGAGLGLVGLRRNELIARAVAASATPSAAACHGQRSIEHVVILIQIGRASCRERVESSVVGR